MDGFLLIIKKCIFHLAPTYDFIMKLLHVGGMVEVISPASLRKSMKGWISDMYDLYKND